MEPGSLCGARVDGSPLIAGEKYQHGGEGFGRSLTLLLELCLWGGDPAEDM